MRCMLICEWESGSQAIYDQDGKITSWEEEDDLNFYTLRELGCDSLDLREAKWQHPVYWSSWYNWEYGATEHDWQWPDQMKEEYLL